MLAAACDGDGERAAPARPSSSSTSTAAGGALPPHGAPPHGGAATSTGPTTPPAPEFAVPGTIDAPYVERVLAELDRVQGDVVRRIVATRAYTPDEELSVRAVFNDPEFAVQAEVFRGLVDHVDRARMPPGDNRSTVVDVLSASPTCITAETMVDVSATAVDPPPPYRVFVVLRPTQPGADPEDRNRTPWSIADELPERRDPCA